MNIFKAWGNLKVGVRLIIGFLIVIILGGVVGIVGIQAVNSTQNMSNVLTKAQDLNTGFLNTRNIEKEALSTRAQETVDLVNKDATDLIAAGTALKADFSDVQAQKTLDVIGTKIDNYTKIFNQYVGLLQANADVLTVWGQVGTAFNALVADIRSKTDKGGDIYLQADKLETTFVLQRVAAVYFCKDLTDARWDAFKTAQNNTKTEISTLADMTKNSAVLSASVADIQAQIANYATESEKYYANVLSMRKANEDWKAISSTISGSAKQGDEYYGGTALLVSLAQDSMASSKASSMMLIIIFIAAAVVVGMFMAIVTMRGITGPVNKMKVGLNKIAIGDTSEKVNVNSKDEIGQMARSYSEMQQYLIETAASAEKLADGDLTITVTPKAESDTLGNAFSKMINNLRTLVSKVNDNAQTIASASDQLATASEQSGSATEQIASVSQQVAKGAEEQTKGIGEVNNAIGELGKAIETVDKGSQQQSKAVEQATGIVQQVSSAAEQTATSAQEAATSASQAADVAKQGSATVEKTIDGIRKINGSMQDVAKKVGELGKQSEAIGGMIAVIDDIASQTNLLALNAAIEAARAGEQGRGFAVVADEVKKLAERTAKETKEIAALVGSVQKGVADSIQASLEGAKQAEQGSNLANEAGTALGQILDSINSMTSQIENISAAAEQMSASAQEMVKVVDGVAKIAEQNLSVTKQMADNKTRVAESASTVAATVEENSAATQQMSASAEEMSAQVQEVVASSKSLSTLAEELKQAVMVFKLNKDNSIIAVAQSVEQNIQVKGNGKKSKAEVKETVTV
jgi:methyl-accepting chemotaxis protein